MREWNAVLYDKKHDFVSKFGGSLVELLAPQKEETVLDLGCGTGDLANEITNQGAIVHGIDASETMIYQAQTKYPQIQFSVRDATQIDTHHQFDAVFSNASLHWIKQPEMVVQNVYNALKTNGRFVAEMGGKGNISSIVNAIKQSMDELGYTYIEDYFPWYFPTAEEYSELLQHAGFQVKMMTLYERPTPLIGEDGIRNWLQMFSNNIFQHLSEYQKNNVVQLCEKILKPQLYKEHTWIADYWRLRFVAVK
ncbi:class I SAM-dependent methyltransferase [Rummeliibacillus sp. NPDC094406]|uniref:class I SAM-dependent methyltransferase n=1 Tax=Rummeliibacillus sp. NPDC094406 TaxID=3364511 RepID=UPI0037F3114F